MSVKNDFVVTLLVLAVKFSDFVVTLLVLAVKFNDFVVTLLVLAAYTIQAKGQYSEDGRDELPVTIKPKMGKSLVTRSIVATHLSYCSGFKNDRNTRRRRLRSTAATANCI